MLADGCAIQQGKLVRSLELVGVLEPVVGMEDRRQHPLDDRAPLQRFGPHRSVKNHIGGHHIDYRRMAVTLDMITGIASLFSW